MKGLFWSGSFFIIGIDFICRVLTCRKKKQADSRPVVPDLSGRFGVF